MNENEDTENEKSAAIMRLWDLMYPKHVYNLSRMVVVNWVNKEDKVYV